MKSSLMTAVCIILVVPLIATAAPRIEWIRRQGGPLVDESYGLSSDQLGNIYLAGFVSDPNNTFHKAITSKYDALGNHVWTRQDTSTNWSEADDVFADRFGNIYTTGFTQVVALGYDSNDVFLNKYDAAGTLRWSRQFGSTVRDHGTGVTVDESGNVLVTGYTDGNIGGTNVGGEDAFVRKYDALGNIAWTVQRGTIFGERPQDIAADRQGNVYVAGDDSDGPFLMKLDAAGAQIWLRHFANLASQASSVSTDSSGNVFIAGSDPRYAILAKFDNSGTVNWSRSLGQLGVDTYGFDVTIDESGNPYMGGSTFASVGAPNAGARDAYVAKFNTVGDILWTFQAGSADNDFGRAITTDDQGRVYISGHGGTLGGGAGARSNDIWLIKIVPEPSTKVLAIIASMSFGYAWRYRRQSRASSPPF